jgi:outer membrane PBP1 activator LpoA protein
VAIGLLLPLTGSNAVPAGLIRDGFLAAVSRMPEAGRPVVRVYDTGAMPVGTALQNARAEGAGFIVGPLTKRELTTAVEQRPGNLPMLLLNTLPGSGSAGAGVYQYGLAPEDEARQIARQMVAAGQRNAVVLAPASSAENDWGTRVSTAFTEELTRAGGQVVVQGRYDRGSANLTPQTEAILGVTDSKSRHDRIEKITGTTLGFEPRPRPDIDAIFLAGYPPDAGTINALIQINPTLSSYARGTPIFMNQDGLDSETQLNRELAGIYLLDMPWLLDTSGPAADLRTATESIWSGRGPLRQSRFFAFGFDAASVVLAIRRPSTAWPLNGLTGRLNINPEGRVERSQLWARISSTGTVQPADPAAR